MPASKPTVFIVDDDDAVRRFLSDLIESVELRAVAFATASQFLEVYQPHQPGCLVLDVRMPGMSGLELQKELADRAIDLPVIILTGHGNLQLAVHAMKAGAVDFIEKPFDNELLLDRIQSAVRGSVSTQRERIQKIEIANRIQQLSSREREVLELVVGGQTNKGVARQLNISEKTVEIHRANVMRKMHATSLAHLVKLATDRYAV